MGVLLYFMTDQEASTTFPAVHVSLSGDSSAVIFHANPSPGGSALPVFVPTARVVVFPQRRQWQDLSQ